MAEWKKVVVSGSGAVLSQLNVGANQQITTAQSTTFLTGSFTGSFTGNGAGLTGVTATAVFPTTLLTPLTSATQIFANDGSNKYVTAGQITASAYAGVSGDITISAAGVAAIAANSVALGTDTTGDYVASITSGNGLTGGTSGEGSTPTLAVGAGTHITVNPDDVAVNTTTLTPAISGSIFTQVSGDITITTGGVATIAANSVALGTDTTGNYVQDITAGPGINTLSAASEGTQQTISVNSGSMLPYYSGSIFGTVSGDITITAAGNAQIGSGVIVNADIAAGAAIAASKINFASTGIVSASVLSSPGQGQALLTTNGVAGSTIDLGLETGDSPTFAGLTITNGNIAINNGTSTALTTTGTTAALFNTNATTLNVGGAATTIAIGSAAGTTTFNGNAIVQGNFTVNGTTTTIDTTNITVEDRFIMVNHGSGSVAPTHEGGIIVEGTTANSGSAFYYDGDTVLRWGVALGVAESAVSVAANSYVVTVSGSTSNPTGDPVYGGATNGYGNMYVNTSDSSIWIYA